MRFNMRGQSLRKWLYRLLAVLIGSWLFFLWLDFLFPIRTAVPYSQVITDRHGVMLHAFLARDDKWRMHTKLEEVSPDLIKTILYKEDQYFYWHWGINPVSVVRAAWNNAVTGRKTSGASTITMQVARLLEPKSRTYLSKALEVFRAAQLEWHYSKNELLELYLNLVPYGSNVEGVKAASMLYLGRLPSQLSLSQAVVLSIVPNRPTTLALGSQNEAIAEARDLWLGRLSGLFEAGQIADALDESIDAYRREAPKLAPHFSWRLRGSYPDQPMIQSSLDLGIQHKLESQVYRYAQYAKRYNVHNAAAIVVDNRTREILAYVGSPDFGDRDHAGQVDGAKAYRSPGSTLKPLIYGMAFDLGVATPQMVVTDLPIDFDGYRPENFDKSYHGKLTIEKALAHSLNTVAVKTLDDLGTQTFIERLANTGFADIKRKSRSLGLSVALGGCGASLEELVSAYAALANHGAWMSLKDRGAAVDAAVWQETLISPEAAYMVTEILSQLERPDFPNNYQYSTSVPKVAWKTGTSYGRRDAWSIGFNRRYTIGIWLGNFDNHGSRQLTGAGMATPLLFKVFNEVDKANDERWFEQPDGLDFRYVCAESGLPPSDYCDNQVMDWFLPQVSSHVRCTHLKQYWISADASTSYCATCLPSMGYRKALYPHLSPELINYYTSEGIPFEAVPPHNPSCPRVLREDPPRITSPVDGRTYQLVGDATEMALEAQAEGDVAFLYWYVDDRFYQKVKAGQSVFFTPSKGKTKISCSDDRGRNTDAWVIFE